MGIKHLMTRICHHYIFNDVDYDNVANFLKKIDLKEDDLGDGVLHGHKLYE